MCIRPGLLNIRAGKLSRGVFQLLHCSVRTGDNSHVQLGPCSCRPARLTRSVHISEHDLDEHRKNRRLIRRNLAIESGKHLLLRCLVLLQILGVGLECLRRKRFDARGDGIAGCVFGNGVEVLVDAVCGVLLGVKDGLATYDYYRALLDLREGPYGVAAYTC